MDALFNSSSLIVFAFLSFLIGVMLRLLDNSASIFLNHKIFVQSSYVSKSIIKEQIENTKDSIFKKSLQNILLLRKLHNFFILLSVILIFLIVIKNVFLK